MNRVKNGRKKEAFENESIGFYIGDDESVWFYSRMGDWIYGRLFSDGKLNAFEKVYYKKTRDSWGYKLVHESVDGVLLDDGGI